MFFSRASRDVTNWNGKAFLRVLPCLLAGSSELVDQVLPYWSEDAKLELRKDNLLTLPKRIMKNVVHWQKIQLRISIRKSNSQKSSYLSPVQLITNTPILPHTKKTEETWNVGEVKSLSFDVSVNRSTVPYKENSLQFGKNSLVTREPK